MVQGGAAVCAAGDAGPVPARRAAPVPPVLTSGAGRLAAGRTQAARKLGQLAMWSVGAVVAAALVTVVAGCFIGALLFTTLGNGANLLGVDPFWEMVIEGLLIAAVVYLDNIQKQRQAGLR